MKCGADEISGTVFALGLKKARNVLWNDGDNMNQRERRVLDGILKSAASLISDAGFRPRFEKVTSSDRYYLNVQPLWRLINIYRQRQATDRRDKIYALLGMSSEDPGASSLLPDYSISWETAVRRSAHALGILRPESSVIMNACDDSDFVLIRGKGRVLARLKDSWTTGTLMVCWSDIGVALGWSDGKRLSNDIHSVFPTPSEELREGDVLFLLETGSTPLLVRVCSDYLRILQIVDITPREVRPTPDNKMGLHEALLVWERGPAGINAQAEWAMDLQGLNTQLKGLEGDFNQVIRILNTSRTRYAAGTLWWDSADYSHNDHLCMSGGGALSSPEMQAIEIYNNMLATPSNDGDAEYCNILAKLMGSFSGPGVHYPVCMSPLWLAARTRRSSAANRILGYSNIDGIRELRLAVTLNHPNEAVAVDLLARDSEGKSIIMRLLEIRCADPMFAWKEHDTITRMFHRFMSLNKAVGEAILYAGVECERFDSPTVLSLAIKYGLSLESQNPQGRTLLMLAALEGDDELVRCLVENGIGPKEYDRDNGGFTALMWAIKGAYLGIVQDLVSAGHGQLEARNHDRRTALMLAALWHRADITQYLVEFDQSQLDAKDKKGATPLMLALIGDLQTDFYTSPSNPEETDLVVGNKLGVPDKMTPAKEKCIANLETIVKVASQAQLNARDHQGRTALMRAIWPGRNSDVELTLKEVLCLMDNSLLDVEVRDNNGESAGAWIRQTMRRSNWLREDDELCSWEYMLEFIKMKLCETQDRPCLRTAEGLLSPKMAETETDW